MAYSDRQPSRCHDGTVVIHVASLSAARTHTASRRHLVQPHSYFNAAVSGRSIPHSALVPKMKRKRAATKNTTVFSPETARVRQAAGVAARRSALLSLPGSWRACRICYTPRWIPDEKGSNKLSCWMDKAKPSGRPLVVQCATQTSWNVWRASPRIAPEAIDRLQEVVHGEVLAKCRRLRDDEPLPRDFWHGVRQAGASWYSDWEEAYPALASAVQEEVPVDPAVAPPSSPSAAASVAAEQAAEPDLEAGSAVAAVPPAAATAAVAAGTPSAPARPKLTSAEAEARGAAGKASRRADLLARPGSWRRCKRCGTPRWIPEEKTAARPWCSMSTGPNDHGVWTRCRYQASWEWWRTRNPALPPEAVEDISRAVQDKAEDLLSLMRPGQFIGDGFWRDVSLAGRWFENEWLYRLTGRTRHPWHRDEGRRWLGPSMRASLPWLKPPGEHQTRAAVRAEAKAARAARAAAAARVTAADEICSMSCFYG